jgi:hypothetical protein
MGGDSYDVSSESRSQNRKITHRNDRATGSTIDSMDKEDINGSLARFILEHGKKTSKHFHRKLG